MLKFDKYNGNFCGMKNPLIHLKDPKVENFTLELLTFNYGKWKIPKNFVKRFVSIVNYPAVNGGALQPS